MGGNISIPPAFRTKSPHRGVILLWTVREAGPYIGAIDYLKPLDKPEFGMQEPGNHYSTGGGKCNGCTGVLRWEMQNFADPFAEYGKIPANAEKIAKGIAFFENHARIEVHYYQNAQQ